MDTVTLAKQEREKQGSKMDTVVMAKQERVKQGPWETEVSYGGEASLHQLLNGCDKNPGHQKFIPVDQFNVEHLPPGYRDNDLVDYVRVLSDVTVRVSVKHVSERRPETVSGSDKPYPSYKDRDMMRTGTGSVYMVVKYPNERDSPTTCKCQECLDSHSPKSQFAKIYIQTSAHVVYDELEAAHTTCHLFFDNGGSPDKCSGVQALSGWAFMGKGQVGDWIDMVHVTHDLDLADRLHNMVDRWDKVWKKVDNKYPALKSGEQKPSSPSEHLPEALEKVNNKYPALISGEQKPSSPSEHLPEASEKVNSKSGEQESSSSSERLPEAWEKAYNKYRGLVSGEQESSPPSEYLLEVREMVNNKFRGLEPGEQKLSPPSDYLPEASENLTIIVSHPHGCSKQVSFGYCTGTGRDEVDLPTWTRYTTPTCRGSSGANVFVLADNGGDRIHCGNCEDDKNLNFGDFCWT